MLSLSSLEIKLKPVAIATKPSDCGVNALFGVSAPRTIFASSNNLGSFLSRWYFLLWRQMNTRHHDARALHSERQMVWHFVPWLLVSLCELEQKEILHLCQQNSLSAKDTLFYLLWHVTLLSNSYKIIGFFRI